MKTLTKRQPLEFQLSCLRSRLPWLRQGRGYGGAHRRLPLLPSEKAYDWLGSGIYFWENDPERELEWATAKAESGAYSEPFVLGAIIDLGNCLDLITRKFVPLIQTSYFMLKSQIEATGGKMPVNSDARGDKNSDKLIR